MHTLVPPGVELPYTGKHIFSTVHDDQREICILIFAGAHPASMWPRRAIRVRKLVCMTHVVFLHLMLQSV